MPGLAQMRPPHPGNATPASSRSPAGRSAGVWSKKQDDVDFDQLQKLWTGLPPHARQELLRVDKHMLFEQARKNLFCSRCNGLLLEGFSQIVTYGKSLQQEACARTGTAAEDESSDMLDPSVHPWGGLVASRDGILTLMDCYLRGRSLRILQNVFDSARSRERERELLYPDACGGGGRGWISHGMANHGRTHGARETCALHTSRISCDTLVDFWSTLGDEMRSSLFRMREDDFIEQLMYRFDSKRFCRDCRKNVVREFKELKELKRSRREPRCTAWFCAADSAFQYEVSKDKVQADWNQSFMDSSCTYHHYEWAIGSGEGKTDIFAFEDVGMTTTVLTDGLELCGIDACYITVRAYRSDGRHTELSVKAHALKGKSCVHRRLVIGDGFVAITQGECIRSFFDHAEEAEDEEDDDAIDKDVNDLDSDGSRPQKHAKSPELAREFLLDAASVIFKGQVEKAYRDGTARQNAHSLFVCLALKLLEERLLVAGKEIITYEKQVKLLEEEEKEKREEEERRERRRAKERVKKLRRKERLRGKECEMERNGGKPDTVCILEDSLESPQEAPSVVLNDGFLDNEVGSSVSVSLTPPETHDNQQSGGSSRNQKLIIGGDPNDWKINGSFKLEQPRSSRRRLRFTYNFSADQEFQWSERGPYTKDDGSDARSCGSVNGYITASNGGHRYSRDNSAKSNARNFTPRFDKLLGHGSKSQVQCRNGYHSGNCHQIGGYRGKDPQFGIMSNHETKAIKNVDNASRLLSHGNRQGQKICTYDVPIASKEKNGLARRNIARDIISKRQVWEPTDPRKKNLRNDTEISSVSRALADHSSHRSGNDGIQNGLEKLHDFQAPNKCCLSANSMQPANSKDHIREENVTRTEGNLSGYTNSFVLDTKPCYSKANDDEVESYFSSPVSPLNNGCTMASGTSSENCSSCISEADSIASSSTARNAEYSSTSDSEDVIQQSEGGEIQVSTSNELASQEDRVPPFSGGLSTGLAFDSYAVPKIFRDDMVNGIHKIPPMGNRTTQHQSESLPVYNHGAHSYAPLPLMGYNNQHPTSWSAAANSGMVPFLRPSYMFPSPFGYNMLACQPPDYYVHYGAPQLPPNPELLVNQSPQKINSINSNEKMKHWRAVRSNGSGVVDSLNFTSDPLPMHVEKQGHPKPLTRENHMESRGKLKGDVTSFSLFHFNGPVAVAPGNSLDSSPIQNETVLSDCQTKETVVEEYSLFAGSRFSFF